MTTPADQRTIVWFESNHDLQQIANNNWQFQIAKLVTTGNGVGVFLWRHGWLLGVGNVGYQYPGNPGIHIVVGVKNAATGNYDPIFIDQTKLFLGSSATYQPQEEVIWWLASSNLTGSVYYHTQGAQGGVNLSSPAPDTDQYEYRTSYLVSTGSWVNSQTAPPSSYTAPPPSEVAESPAPTLEVFVWPWVGAIGLTAAVAAAKRSIVKADLTAKLSKNYSSVEVDFESTSGLKIKFTLSKASSAAFGLLDALGYTAGNDPKDDVAAAVNTEIKAGGVFPDGEKWKWDS